MFSYDDVICLRISFSTRITFVFFVVLLSCSSSIIGASGVETSSARTMPDPAETEDWLRPEMEFLKKFLVVVVKEALKDRCESQTGPDLEVLRLMDGTIRLGGTLEKEEIQEQGQKKRNAGDSLAARGTFSSNGGEPAEAKKSATEVFRDHKLKTLFRWGKRDSE